jgi:hypothetical protein
LLEGGDIITAVSPTEALTRNDENKRKDLKKFGEVCNDVRRRRIPA